MDSVESTTHALFYCSKLKDAWFHSITCMKEVKPKLRIWKRGVPKDFTKFFLIAWGLRSWRNKKIFKNASLTPELVIENTIFNHVFFIDCNRVPPSEYRRAGCWISPMENVYKLNIDGALLFDINNAVIGAILRDSNGNTVMADSKKERDLLQPALVESLAILYGLQFCL